MSAFVLDTSVVVQWFEETGELHVKEAKQIFEDLNSGKINIIIPDLLLVELLNALLIGKKCGHYESGLATRRIFELPINIVAVDLSILQRALSLMVEHNLTSYDAYFLALAQYEGCKLISDDQKAHGKIADGTVLMLEDY